MIKIENTETYGWEAAIRGMRNPLNSWDRSDSYRLYHGIDEDGNDLVGNTIYIGNDDHDLMMRLVKSGTEHAKFMRMIHVSMDVTAPLYWWKEADQYKVGTVTNSCSTMHKIHAKRFMLEDFSCEHIFSPEIKNVEFRRGLELTLDLLNEARENYLIAKDKAMKKIYWWQMIQLLPSSYNQRRTWDLNYATLRAIYHQRKGHKLDEWNDFCKWVETLPYSELLTGEETVDKLAYTD